MFGKKLAGLAAVHRPTKSPEFDPSTLSNYSKFVIEKPTDLHFTVHFDTKSVQSKVTYHLKKLFADEDELVLDTSFLDIQSVSVNGTTVQFRLEPRSEPLGSALHIPLGLTEDDSIIVSIVSNTTQQCTALQFIDKSATDGKAAPYLFSQCQAIHARSLLPCFDTPGVKLQYNMQVTSPYASLMSGRHAGVITESAGGLKTYKFTQPIPIPSYLIAIASGDIASAPIGPRSHVFSEPGNLKACKHEFEHDMESFLQTAENLVFPYEWDQYDALILPASFPYGGMENPNITFATPTLILGDRQNVDVLAHELAHSWLGNLVTNCLWEHFWLNEGWTVYLERRIQGAIHGEAERHFSAIIGWSDLENSIKSMGDSAERYLTLVQNLKDRLDPDDAFLTVPYEKGFNLLFLIEQIVGIELFSKFIPHYFNTFKYKSLDTYQFLDTLYEFFDDKRALLDEIDWESWLYKPGMPPIKPNFDTTLVDQVYSLVDKWYGAVVQGKLLKDVFSETDIAKFNANQSVVFLESLVKLNNHKSFKWADYKLALKTMSEIYLSYNGQKNAEVIFRWYVLQVTGENSKYYDQLGEWLGTVGRMKFVRPGYVLLNRVDHEKAIHYFRKFEGNYHPICRAMVEKDLGL